MISIIGTARRCCRSLCGSLSESPHHYVVVQDTRLEALRWELHGGSGSKMERIRSSRFCDDFRMLECRDGTLAV